MKGRQTNCHALQVLVFASLFLVYVMMQTFAIPGTLSLSVMAGALYGILRGLLFVSGLLAQNDLWLVNINACAGSFELQRILS